MSNQKRQHYVPQFYLEFFVSGDGTFWVYDKEGGLPRKQTPINTAVESYFYSVDTPRGEKDNYVEDELSKVESTARPILAHWQSKGVRPEKPEILQIALFLGFNAYAGTEKCAICQGDRRSSYDCNGQGMG